MEEMKERLRPGVKELFTAMAEMVDEEDVAIVLYTTKRKDRTMDICEFLRDQVGDDVYEKTLGWSESLFLTGDSLWKVELSKALSEEAFMEREGVEEGKEVYWDVHDYLKDFVGPTRGKVILPNMVLIDDNEKCLLLNGGVLIKVEGYGSLSNENELDVERVMEVVRRKLSE